MIIDLDKFIQKERPFWSELEEMLKQLERDPLRRLEFEELQRLHYLYERVASALGKLATYSLRPETVSYVEQLVAAAYAEVHDGNRRSDNLSFKKWFLDTWPQTIRKHSRALCLATLVMLVGCGFGAFALMFDPEAKAEILPFPHLLGDPSDRVDGEESTSMAESDKSNTQFSAMLMTHNTRVAITTLCLGITWGLGTIIMLFYNGVILGAVGSDYLMAGEGLFLFAWLLPHGIVEIPAILIAGQGGLVFASAMVGWKSHMTFAARMRSVIPDLATLIAGAALMLIWAGFIEAFLSQDHEPRLSYHAKIIFGVIEAMVIIGFFSHYGSPHRTDPDHRRPDPPQSGQRSQRT